MFIARPGGAKLLDFGLSAMRGATDAALAQLATQPMRVTAEGAIVGTLHYLAPERLDGQEADARSDIYAFGVILHEMLSGKRPFDEPTQARLIAAILKGEPAPLDPPPGTPAELQTIVRVALARDPDDRWQSIGDVAKMLKAVAARFGASATESAAPRRWRAWTVVPSLAAVALGIAVVALALRARQVRPAQPVVSFPLPPPDGGAFRTDRFVGADGAVRGLARWPLHCVRRRSREWTAPAVDSIGRQHRGAATGRLRRRQLSILVA